MGQLAGEVLQQKHAASRAATPSPSVNVGLRCFVKENLRQQGLTGLSVYLVAAHAGRGVPERLRQLCGVGRDPASSAPTASVHSTPVLRATPLHHG